jgi:hypothetical protein
VALSPQVTGVRETLNELAKLEPKLKFKAISKMKVAARPIVAAMEQNFPEEAPISGMARGKFAWKGRPKLVVRYKGNPPKWYSSYQNVWNLISIRTPSNNHGAQMFDMSENGRFGKALTERYGHASRAMWRVDDTLKDETQKAILDAVEDYTREVNRRLGGNSLRIRRF